ncbi:MAG: hypothetical protein LBN92_03310 [Treponema sp.]|jgi:hypothetical protein|nr:hypothetical protein [Treponema sp.]
MMIKKIAAAAVVCFTLAAMGGAQETADQAAAEIAGEDASAGDTVPVLPRAFRGINLGMGLDDLEKALTEDSLFAFRGDRDVSFLPPKEENLIESAGLSFIRRAFFQLRGGRLYIMAYSLDESLVDHYSVFTALVKKYGEPKSLNPREAVWEDGATRVSVERPLTVKYLDRETFNEILEQGKTEESHEVYLRKLFVDEF